jgi:uncharacterized protein with HEPN domain
LKLETAKRLHDAAEACREIQHFCAGQSRERFLADRGLKLIIWKLTEIVGEALRQAEWTDPDVTNKVLDLRDIVDTRNRLTHGYDSVNFSLLWDIVQIEVPPLRATLLALLEGAPDIESPRQP